MRREEKERGKKGKGRGKGKGKGKRKRKEGLHASGERCSENDKNSVLPDVRTRTLRTLLGWKKLPQNYVAENVSPAQATDNTPEGDTCISGPEDAEGKYTCCREHHPES